MPKMLGYKALGSKTARSYRVKMLLSRENLRTASARDLNKNKHLRWHRRCVDVCGAHSSMKSSPVKIEHILCPTDLSSRSQLTLNFASGIAARLSAKITACHFSETAWFANDQSVETVRKMDIERSLVDVIKGERNGSAPEFGVTVSQASYDPSRDILELADELDVDLIVMKARRGVYSALHYGSLVERVTRGSRVPVLLLPTRFLDSHPRADEIDFNEVLFDYDFSEATDRLFPLAMALTEGFNAHLNLLAVLEPPAAESVEAAHAITSQAMLKSVTQQKLNQLIDSRTSDAFDSQATVTWGRHADTVLSYAERQNVDLICTTLPPAYFYYEKLYCAYLGQLLQSANCPILALRSV